MFDSATPWTAALQASLSITNSQNLLKLMSIESVMPYNHLILCHHFSCLQSFPASGSFLMSQFFASVGQSIEVSASASVLPLTIQDWSPLGWTSWISLQSKGLSRVFSSTTVQITLKWSSRSENGGAPEMRGWLGEEGSHQGNLGTCPHSSPIAPCACCLHGSSGGDTAPGAVPLRTPQGTEAAASPWGLPMRKARVRGQGRAWREEEEEAGA